MDLKGLDAFHFLYPEWLLAIAPLLLIAGWFLWRRRRAGNWSQVVDADLLPALRLQDGDRKGSPWMLIGLGWILAVLALAGPAWRRVESPARPPTGSSSSIYRRRCGPPTCRRIGSRGRIT